MPPCSDLHLSPGLAQGVSLMRGLAHTSYLAVAQRRVLPYHHALISVSLNGVFRPSSLWFGAAMMFLGTIAYGESNELSAVRIGYQKYGTLNVVKAEGGFEKSLTDKGVKITWILFTAGPQLMEALNAGSIDFGNVGEAPPVFRTGRWRKCCVFRQPTSLP